MIKTQDIVNFDVLSLERKCSRISPGAVQQLKTSVPYNLRNADTNFTNSIPQTEFRMLLKRKLQIFGDMFGTNWNSKKICNTETVTEFKQKMKSYLLHHCSYLQ